MSPEVWESHYLSGPRVVLSGPGLSAAAVRCFCLLRLSLLFFSPSLFFFHGRLRTGSFVCPVPGSLQNRLGRASNISQSSTSFLFSEWTVWAQREKKNPKNYPQDGRNVWRGQVRILYLLCRTGHAEWRYVTDRMCACTVSRIGRSARRDYALATEKKHSHNDSGISVKCRRRPHTRHVV